MKIKNKLTLIFTLIIAVILICLNLYIYILSSSFTKNNFYNQLKDRAIVTATVFLEADEESSAIIKSFQKKYLSTLPNEIIRIYTEQNKPAFINSSDTISFDNSFINAVRKKKEYREEKGDRQTLGIYYQDNQGNFVIIASAVDETGIRNLYQLQKVLLIGFLLSIVVVFFAGRYFTKLMFKPISDIALQANKISETNLHLRLNEGNKKDELAELSVTINRMLHRLENAFELQKNFVANASHELRTPLTSIIGNIDVTLSKVRTIEEYEAVLASIMEEAEKLHKVTDGLLNLTQSNVDFSNLRKEDIRLDELLIEIKDEMHVKRPGSNVEIIFREMPDTPFSLIIPGDRNLLETAILNIIDNACKFSNNKKVVAALLLPENNITIKISDSGIGIAENELPHVTETFYRANNARTYSGSGIGLALADKIIKLHGGKFTITSELNKGTEVSVSFPRMNLND
ncbi:MAG TPA: HAMP domain-containing sensor histidine kinase [Chitinophagaceae bacterium]|nr:HAMP domain-containing sensor histidine kinase [Chitinophagaceae bacterium]